MGSGHTLLVLRHAKAAGEPGVNDAERPLTGGGELADLWTPGPAE